MNVPLYQDCATSVNSRVRPGILWHADKYTTKKVRPESKMEYI